MCLCLTDRVVDMGLLSKRTSTAVLALSLVLSACGTGTESSSSERTRNNALGASSCVSATGSGQQSTSTAQANVDKLAKTLASKKKAFNKAQKAFAKERKRKPAPRKPLLKTLYKKTKTTGNCRLYTRNSISTSKTKRSF